MEVGSCVEASATEHVRKKAHLAAITDSRCVCFAAGLDLKPDFRAFMPMIIPPRRLKLHLNVLHGQTV